MLNLKKALTEIIAIMGVENFRIRSHSITTPVPVTARPYNRVVLLVPSYFSKNSFQYKVIVRQIAPNETSFLISPLPIDGGTYTQDGSVTIDAEVIIFRRV